MTDSNSITTLYLFCITFRFSSSYLPKTTWGYNKNCSVYNLKDMIRTILFKTKWFTFSYWWVRICKIILVIYAYTISLVPFFIIYPLYFSLVSPYCPKILISQFVSATVRMPLVPFKCKNWITFKCNNWIVHTGRLKSKFCILSDTLWLFAACTISCNSLLLSATAFTCFHLPVIILRAPKIQGFQRQKQRRWGSIHGGGLNMLSKTPCSMEILHSLRWNSRSLLSFA